MMVRVLQSETVVVFVVFMLYYGVVVNHRR